MSRIAIMQGRLLPPEPGRFQSFPRLDWRKEFSLAAEAELQALEWIYDLPGEDVNPFATDAGIDEMKMLSSRHGVTVASICADYFMERPLLRRNHDFDGAVVRLEWLLARCAAIGIERVVLPFVDQSRLENKDDEDCLVSVLGRVLPKAERMGVELHLETSLTPSSFARLLEQVQHAYLKVNYDSGNSSSLGYAPAEEFAVYGTRIGSVHIKDRVHGGGTVPLGTGDADFTAVFRELAAMEYSGDYVLQVARGRPGQELELAKQNKVFLVDHLERASHAYGSAMQ